MFFPDEDDNDDYEGSEGRYWRRIKRFKDLGRPVKEHHLWWLIHNCVAHPFVGLLPYGYAVRFHDYSSDRLNLPKSFDPKKRVFIRLSAHSPIPVIPWRRRLAWVYHHTIVHILIGLWPSPTMFNAHDQSAKTLGVKGWV
jgi:hypothetical protein